MMKTNFPNLTHPSASNGNALRDGVELLQRNECREEDLTLRFSLSRVILGGNAYYAVTAENDHGGAAAELLGNDEECAEELYLRLVRGAVPPSVLHEIVVDLLA